MRNEITKWTPANILEHPDLQVPEARQKRSWTRESWHEHLNAHEALLKAFKSDESMPLNRYLALASRLSAPYSDSEATYEFPDFILEALKEGQTGVACVHLWQKHMIDEEAKVIGLKKSPKVVVSQLMHPIKDNQAVVGTEIIDTSLSMPNIGSEFGDDRNLYIRFYGSLYEKNKRHPWWVNFGFRLQSQINHWKNRIFEKDLLKLRERENKKK